LIVQPELLVLDEPTSALDVTIQKQVLALLQRLQRERGLAYLLITHDVAVVRAMAHEVIVLKDGEVVEAGSAAQVLGAPGTHTPSVCWRRPDRGAIDQIAADAGWAPHQGLNAIEQGRPVQPPPPEPLAACAATLACCGMRRICVKIATIDDQMGGLQTAHFFGRLSG
jgi:hypothetical protein